MDTLVEHLIIVSHIGVKISFYVLKFPRMLRKLFGPKRDEVTGEWRKLHNDKLCGLHFSPTIIRLIISRRKRWMKYVARVRRGAYRVLMGRPEGKKSLGRPRCRREANIKWIFKNLDEAWTGLIWLGIGTGVPRL
jgi:hypothetical protein